MKFTLARMLSCEWAKLWKIGFPPLCRSAPFPKSPTSIKSVRNSSAHRHQVSGYAKDKYPKPSIQHQISKTISKTANPYIKEKKHRELFSPSTAPPSIWNPDSGFQRKTKHPKNIETYQARTLKPKYANTKYIFRAEMPKQLVILSSIFWRTQKAFTDNSKFYCSCCELYIHSCEVSFCRGKRLRPTSKYLLWNFQESYLALVRTSEDERIALKEIGN